jgi:MFS family permease
LNEGAARSTIRAAQSEIWRSAVSGTKTAAKRARRLPPWIAALGVTSLMQVTSAFLTAALLVIGPTLTAASGVPPERIGHLAAASSLGTMLFLLAGNPLLPRFGAVRLLQAGALIGALSLGLALVAWWPAMMLAALAGGIAYGPSPPAGSDILQRHSPTHRRVLAFSIKQAAVPLGGVFCGLILPPLATLYGWRVGLIAVGLIATATILLVEPWRRALEADREPQAVALQALFAPAALMRPFRALGAVPDLPRLSYAGFAFAVNQGCLLGFFVTDLVDGLGHSLQEAGIAFAVLQGAGVVARIVMGWVADRLGAALRTLRILAGAAAAGALLAGAFAPAWPIWSIHAAAIVMGFTATSWNGLYLAEVARVAPPGRIGEATSGATFLAFIGYVLGPVAFAALVAATGSYRIAFLTTALIPASGLALLLRGSRAAES